MVIKMNKTIPYICFFLICLISLVPSKIKIYIASILFFIACVWIFNLIDSIKESYGSSKVEDLFKFFLIFILIKVIEDRIGTKDFLNYIYEMPIFIQIILGIFIIILAILFYLVKILPYFILQEFNFLDELELNNVDFDKCNLYDIKYAYYSYSEKRVQAHQASIDSNLKTGDYLHIKLKNIGLTRITHLFIYKIVVVAQDEILSHFYIHTNRKNKEDKSGEINIIIKTNNNSVKEVEVEYWYYFIAAFSQTIYLDKFERYIIGPREVAKPHGK